MIVITTYAGYTGDERPKSLVIDGEEHMVGEVIRKELFEDFKTRERSTVFWCEVNKRLVKVIHRPAGGWEVAFPSRSPTVPGRKIWQSVPIQRNEEK